MPQVARAGPDVGPHRLLHQRVGVVPQLRREQPLDGRTNAVDDRPQVARLVRRRLPEFLEGGRDRPALRVAEDDHQSRTEPRGGELDAADLRRRDDVAGHANHEQVAQPLVEHQLGGNARVGAAENDGEGFLPGHEFDAAAEAQEGVEAAHVRGEALVAVAEPDQSFSCGNHRSNG